MTWLPVTLLLAVALPTGPELLERTLAYHDPDGDWMQQRVALVIETGYADGRTRTRECEIDFASADYRSVREEKERRIVTEVAGNGDCNFQVDGNADIGPATAAEFGLDCDRAKNMRDYLSYLWGLPMKLRDAGTVLRPEVVETVFQDQPVLALTVTYEAGVGTDVWRFFVEADTGRMVGYAFGHADDASDGEWIALEGEVKIGTARIPQRRHWYRSADDGFLGTDTLVEGRILPR